MSSYFWWALGYDANWIEETPPALMRAQMDTLQKIRAQDWMLKPHLTRQLAITELDFEDASESESESDEKRIESDPIPIPEHRSVQRSEQTAVEAQPEPPKRDWSTAPVGRTIKKRA
jgi:hypothetical protein